MATGRSVALLCWRNIGKFRCTKISYQCVQQNCLSSQRSSQSNYLTSFRTLANTPLLGLGPAFLVTGFPKQFSTTNIGLKIENDSGGSGTSGLADKVMAAKVASDKKEEEPGEKDQNEKKGPKPLPKWQKYSYIFLGVTMSSSLIINSILFSLPDKDEEGNLIKDEFSDLPFPTQHFKRLKNKIFTTKKAIEEPFSDKLLPDPLPEPYYNPKYTIVLELTGLLVHANWTHKHGWRFQKRPGLDMFLAQVGFPNFELVVWTVENVMTFYPIINGMDPQNQYIMHRLFKDATHYTDGHHLKDLNNLNRDLSKVIVIDWNKNTTITHRSNTLTLEKWKGDNSDRTLIGLAQFLHQIKDSNVDDVRDVLTYYQQFEDPIEAFRENQRKLQEALQLEEERKQKEKEAGAKLSSFKGFSSFSIFRR